MAPGHIPTKNRQPASGILWKNMNRIQLRLPASVSRKPPPKSYLPWSEDMVGNKTFEQVQEEFAEIVIPKVWVREGKNISRVVECLSISPKKTRRIL